MKYNNQQNITYNTNGIIRLGRLCRVALPALLLGACASGPKSFGIHGDGDSALNRDTSGKSLSVVVRLYQLKDTAEFSKLTFDTVASGRPEAELLGPALLGKTDTIVVPGGTYDSTETLQEGARYVGVVALFRQPDPHFWRFLVDADEVRSNGMKFKVKDCYITLNGIKPLPIPGQPTTNYKPTCQNFGSVNAPTVTSTAAKAGQGTTKPPAQRRSAAPRSPLPDIGIAPGTTGTGSYGATVNIGISPSGNR